MESIKDQRKFLHNDLWKEWESIDRDQKKGIKPPAVQKPYPPEAPIIDLVAVQDLTVGEMPLVEALKRRKSRRDFTQESLTIEELSFLLWSTQGVLGENKKRGALFRPVPSAGARHPFETYLLINRVAGLQAGLYRYLSLEHKLCFLATESELFSRAQDEYWLQKNEAVLFIWTITPYRTEWRYGVLAHKMIAMEAGHICQNLYLACEAIHAGACAIGAFWQKEMDALLDIDGEDEFAIYLARVGKV
ncbi:MAG: SagB/ThcOx family dehydrogenase [Chloroflexi bacterium]|nr:SagB/ThcOx family dehydrogenase [Chloroflexota bacterium]